jgi:allantoate deiminase
LVISDLKSPALFEQIEEMVEWLASFGKSKNNGVTRKLYSYEWQYAQQALKKRIKKVGLQAYYDDVGNLFGRLPGTEENALTILTGSHIDTVVDGGKYDGAYGIIAGFLALRYLYEHHGLPKKNIEVVSLCEEEGSRFPMTYWGSGSITGVKSMDDVQGLVDLQNVSFLKAMHEAGFGQGKHRHPFRTDLECFLELHIEQGEILEREEKAIGFVSHIVGQRRYEITVVGESNHAGTTPMAWRKDAMYVASELIRLLIQRAKETTPDLVATVGQLQLEPNISNVIPGKAIFTIDIRHCEEEVIDEFSKAVFKEFQLIADKHETDVSIRNWMNEKPIKMCEKLMELSEMILTRDKVPFKKMVSGAGHDAQMFASFCPTSLLFVPSHKGISHSPYEFTKTEDLEKGIQLLIKVLYELAY